MKESKCSCNGFGSQQQNAVNSSLKELKLLQEAHEYIETLSIALKEEEKRRQDSDMRAAKLTEKASLCIQLNRQFKVNYEFKLEKLNHLQSMINASSLKRGEGTMEQVLQEVQNLNGLYRKENEEMAKQLNYNPLIDMKEAEC